MGTNFNKTISLVWIFSLLAILNSVRESYVEGLQTLDNSNFGMKPKGTVKTIEALEFGDIIDCVDIYKQPAFDNPLIKDLKMAPNSYQSIFNKTNDSQLQLFQKWTKYGECPKGTIPIRRTSNLNDTIRRKYNDNQIVHEYATVIQYFNKGKGGYARLNVWEPRVLRREEFSLSQLWAVSGGRGGRPLDTVEAGWMVHPRLFHDERTRLFTYWSSDNYKEGCYNLVCEGFVQTDDSIAIGGAMEPVSVYNVQTRSLLIGLTRSHEGDWWLVVQDRTLGYFPAQLFKDLNDGADHIAFGGEILNLETVGYHTSTVMGSGHFSNEGFRRASYVSNIRVMNDNFEWVEPNLEIEAVTRPECYDLTFGPSGTNLGSHFYFGGPGFSQRCQ